MIKLIALDMDGTLLDDESKVSKENQYWIQRAEEQGVLVCLSTGRGIQSVSPYLDELQLNTPMVLANGSEVWQRRDTLWRRHTMQAEWISELKEIGMELDVWFWAYATDGPYNREHWIDGAVEDYIWLKFGYYSEDANARTRLHEKLSTFDHFERTNSHPFNMELNPKGVNKASGLREICQRLDLQMSEIVAVGDSLNDIAMIRECGMGVAMGNAQPAVKEAADWVTDSNVDHGVAKVIRKVLEEQ